MLEFKVNDLITLKLKDNKTFIYVAGKQFRQCKQLVLNIPITEITYLENIESIDKIIEKLFWQNILTSFFIFPFSFL